MGEMFRRQVYGGDAFFLRLHNTYRHDMKIYSSEEGRVRTTAAAFAKGGLDVGIKKGDIYYADLTPVVGSEQGGVRPVLIIQNNMGNQFSPTVIAAAITSRKGKRALPTHIRLGDELQGLHGNSMVLLEQIRTIDRARLKEYIEKYPI